MYHTIGKGQWELLITDGHNELIIRYSEATSANLGAELLITASKEGDAWQWLSSGRSQGAWVYVPNVHSILVRKSADIPF